jgi:hypothetical protein
MAGSPCLGWAHAARPGQVRRKPRLSPKSRSIGPAQAKGAREPADRGLGFADEAGEPAARDVAVASLMTSEGCWRVRVGSLVAARAVLRRLSSGYVVPFAPASVRSAASVARRKNPSSPARRFRSAWDPCSSEQLRAAHAPTRSSPMLSYSMRSGIVEVLRLEFTSISCC